MRNCKNGKFLKFDLQFEDQGLGLFSWKFVEELTLSTCIDLSKLCTSRSNHLWLHGSKYAIYFMLKRVGSVNGLMFVRVLSGWMCQMVDAHSKRFPKSRHKFAEILSLRLGHVVTWKSTKKFKFNFIEDFNTNFTPNDKKCNKLQTAVSYLSTSIYQETVRF